MLQWADTFNRYGTNAALMLNGAWIENIQAGTLVTDPDPTSTQKVYNVATGFAFTGMAGMRYALSSSQTTVGMLGRLWMNNIPTASGALSPAFEWRDASNTAICQARINTVGGISIYNSAGTLLGATSGPVVPASAYSHVEIKIFQNSSTGTADIRVNGVTVLSLTGLALGSNPIAQVVVGGNHVTTGDGSTGIYWKDIIFWDGTGTFNNNFMGSVSVVDIDTNADTSLTWTPSTGTVGWSILDNNPPLDDAAYIGAATVLSNTFGLANLPADTTSVRGLVLVNRTRKIDGGDGNVQMGIISGASTGLGTDRPITTAYTYWKDIMEADPATGAAFTPTAFNAASFKLARTV